MVIVVNGMVLKLIKKQNEQIEKLFDRFDLENEDIEFNCVNIIKHLRTLLEHIVTYYYGQCKNIEIRIDQQNLRTITAFMRKKENHILFLYKLHNYLQASSSHYVIDEISAPRLLYKYLPYLIEIRNWFYNTYNVLLLNNVFKFTENQTSGMSEYYINIYNKISKYAITKFEDTNYRYYVYKSIPIIINNIVFYETTIGIASNYASKFNRFIVYSKFKIDDRYAIKLNIIDEFIKIKNNIIPIRIATAFKVSIRPCEFNNLAKLIDINIKIQSNLSEYKFLMNYMTDSGLGIHEIILSNDEEYDSCKREILSNTDYPIIFTIFDKIREIIKKNEYGKNVLKYLLVNMNNNVIKDQRSREPNKYGLYIYNQPFDNYPIAMSIRRHKTSIYTLLEIFDLAPRKDELFYRKIRNRTNEKGVLYHSLEDLQITEAEAELYRGQINSKLYWDESSKILKLGKYYYIKKYEDSTRSIVEKLIQLSNEGISNYSNYINNELLTSGYNIDSPEKKDIILRLFESSKVACIYGPAGTGKSMIAKHISNLFSNSSKKYISNTHPAVMNMFRKIGGNKRDFMTIKSYINNPQSSDILFIDECSMVSNDDMLKILELSNFNCLILLGDIHQIQAIDYGTWFKFIKVLINKTSKYELTELHRTTLPELTILWEKVRKKEDVIDEILSDYGCVKNLDDDSLFTYENNQIILCLNYDGLYGINNLNLILQSKNSGQEFKIGSYIYKINDPVLFTENNKYSKILYNNLKGKITDIQLNDNLATIYLNVETNINVMNLYEYDDLELIKVNDDNTSDISLTVETTFNSDDDEMVSKLVPFQVAYAVSIHKAQGLEYDVVKIVIGENCDEKVTFDIFYTAITRATEKLEIYWTSSTQRNVIRNILEKGEVQDIARFTNKFGYKLKEAY